MSKQDILKNLFKLKLKMIATAVELLPEELCEHAKKLQHSLIKVVNEATGEYLNENKEEEKESLKTIPVE